jgi:hypothetical protein
MNLGLIVMGIVIVIAIVVFISKRNPLIQVARQINLDQLESMMDKLILNKTRS